MEETIFAKWDKAIRGAEASFVNFISAIAPWGAPLPVAYMSFNHMDTVLNFPWGVSIPTALVIEILGFSTVSTIIGFWSHNRKYTDDKRKSPIGIAIGAFVLYLLIVIFMNVALDATVGTPSEGAMVIAVKGLLTLMTIPAALILAVRSQHQEALMDAEESKRERAFKKYYGDDWFEMMYGKAGSSGSQGSRSFTERSVNVRTLNNEKLQIAKECLVTNPNISTREIALAIGASSPATGKKYRDAAVELLTSSLGDSTIEN